MQDSQEDVIVPESKEILKKKIHWGYVKRTQESMKQFLMAKARII